MCGAKAVAQLVRRFAGFELNSVQANVLWLTSRAYMQAMGNTESVTVIENAETKPMDVTAQSELLEAIGYSWTGQLWPLNGSPEEIKQHFSQCLCETLMTRGYKMISHEDSSDQFN